MLLDDKSDPNVGTDYATTLFYSGDIDAALNYATSLPTEGPEALLDDHKNVPVFRAPETV